MSQNNKSENKKDFDSQQRENVRKKTVDDKTQINSSQKNRPKHIVALDEWIDSSLSDADSFNIDHTSHGLKILAQNSTGNHYTTYEFKKAMKKAGYRVKDERQLNWIFNIAKNSKALKK